VISIQRKLDPIMITIKAGNNYMIRHVGKRFGASSLLKSRGVPNVCAQTSMSQPLMLITLIPTVVIRRGSSEDHSNHFADPATPRKHPKRLTVGRVKSLGAGDQQACRGDDFSVYGLER
jgi:hypothetical protein